MGVIEALESRRLLAPLYYRVSAFNDAGESAPSNIAKAVLPLAGDLNGDGAVTGDDYAPIDLHLGQSPATFWQGDANGDGKVSGDDYPLVDLNLGQVSPDGPPTMDFATAPVIVPLSLSSHAKDLLE